MTEDAKTKPIIVRIPDLGLSSQQLNALERSWEQDLTKAVESVGAKITWSIEIKIKIGNDGKDSK